jgi:hypothetical protein
MSLENLSFIGHLGNFAIEPGHNKSEDEPIDGVNKQSLYNPLNFGGTESLLTGMGLLNVGESDFAQVGGSITGTLDGAHNIQMLTFGLDSIFKVGQSGGLLPNLENLGFMKYADMGSMMSSFKAPLPLSLPGKGGRGK